MTPEQITLFIGVGLTVVTGIISPAYLRWKAKQKEDSGTGVVSWQGITTVLQKERDDLRRRIEEMEAENKAWKVSMDQDYARRLHELEAEYQRQLTAANLRIQQLEGEVADLYRRLYQHPPT